MIFDTHAHYEDEAFDEDRSEVLRHIRRAGVEAVVDVGSTLSSCKKIQSILKNPLPDGPILYGAYGIHPEADEEADEAGLRWVKEAILADRYENGAGHIVAVGEIGLDYHYEGFDRERQKDVFLRQLALAREVDLPVIVHTRDAAQDTIDLLKSTEAAGVTGILHCFPFGAELARVCLDLGWTLGIGGVVTFKNGKKMKETAAYAPLDRLVIETDCPYLAPTPYRGKRNDSSYLPLVIDEIAALKGLSAAEVEAATADNAKRVYRL